MGAHLAAEAMGRAYMCALDRDPLSNREWRVLLVMAFRAMDRDGRRIPARVYAGGWQALGYEGLNRTAWNEASKRDVARAISGLKKRGLIAECAEQPGGHKRYDVLPRG